MSGGKGDIQLTGRGTHKTVVISKEKAEAATRGEIVVPHRAQRVKADRVQVRFLPSAPSHSQWQMRIVSILKGRVVEEVPWNSCDEGGRSPSAIVVPRKKIPKAPARATKDAIQPIGKEHPFRRVLAKLTAELYVNIGSHPLSSRDGYEVYAGSRVPARIVEMMLNKVNPGIRENWGETPVVLLRMLTPEGQSKRWLWQKGDLPLPTVWATPLEKWKAAERFETVLDPFVVV